MEPYKFGTLQGDDWIPFAYLNVWEQEKTTGPARLIIAPASGQIELMRKLAEVLPEPFGILYVLLVPRGQGQPGRYQSPVPSSRAELDAFLTQFQEFFERDARHHIWIMSLPASATLVYDNHNVIYAYGPLEKFKQVLKQQGFQEGSVRFPSPHSHNYNVEFDQAEKDVIAYWDWLHFPVAEQDER